MTKNEAYIAMEQGKKITHIYFDDNEFLYIKDGIMYTEDNYKFDHREDGYDGWKDRDSEAFQTGWSIKNNCNAMQRMEGLICMIKKN